MRQIVLDTETTGLVPSEGHRILEIGCVELLDRKPTGNTLHLYINPERDVDEEAFKVHGLTRESLADKPVFAHIVDELLGFIGGAELVIHNAAFDVGFLDCEMKRLGREDTIEQHCTILDTLLLARQLRPGQKNNLDALCRHYGIDNSKRELHGALLDARLLADVYLAMTGGQVRLFSEDSRRQQTAQADGQRRRAQRQRPLVLTASEKEMESHQQLLNALASKGKKVAWLADVTDAP